MVEGKGASTVGRFESPRGKWEKPLLAPWKGWGVEVETTRKILSFHKEEKSSDPNNPQSILLDFISSCQNLRIWTLNTATREYLNNEQLQKGKQIDEWWRQVNKGNHFIKLHGWLNKYVLPKTILQ
ncbi:hypothetical protein MTR67_045281 [Solanum verrucosum]|uniref:Uncharacterized protein n=1 Tax=Solanum verrucosum TaxID=315347 RepID=A0AAF0UVL7_SOLVR|nr:hypothetical protein MTR67_045281 [Solanum verrucosum]